MNQTLRSLEDKRWVTRRPHVLSAGERQQLEEALRACVKVLTGRAR